MKILIKDSINDLSTLNSELKSSYGIEIDDATFKSCVNNLNLNFVREKFNNKLLPLSQIYHYELFQLEEDVVESTKMSMDFLNNNNFKIILEDLGLCMRMRVSAQYIGTWSQNYY